MSRHGLPRPKPKRPRPKRPPKRRCSRCGAIKRPEDRTECRYQTSHDEADERTARLRVEREELRRARAVREALPRRRLRGSAR